MKSYQNLQVSDASNSYRCKWKRKLIRATWLVTKMVERCWHYIPPLTSPKDFFIYTSLKFPIDSYFLYDNYLYIQDTLILDHDETISSWSNRAYQTMTSKCSSRGWVGIPCIDLKKKFRVQGSNSGC
jgi:hypothetical protein